MGVLEINMTLKESLQNIGASGNLLTDIAQKLNVVKPQPFLTEKTPLVKKGREATQLTKEIAGKAFVEALPFGIGRRLSATPEQQQAIKEKYKNYTFKDVAMDVANMGLNFTVNPLARLGLTGQEIIGGKLLGAGVGYGFKDAKTFAPDVIGGLPDIYQYNLESGDNPATAGLRTSFTFGTDLLLGFGMAKVNLPSVRFAARQLPESFLYKTKTENMPLDEIFGSLRGTNSTERGNIFIASLSNEEKKSVFNLARAYEKAGGRSIETIEKTPTRLGEFAEAKRVSIPTEIRLEKQLPGMAIIGKPQPAFGLSIKPVKKVGYGEIPKELEPLAEKTRKAEKGMVLPEIKIQKDRIVDETLAELSFAEVGYRYQIPETGEFKGVSSTFPDWIIPEELRIKPLLDKVVDDIKLGKVPKPDTREDRLYDIVLEKINDKLYYEGLEPIQKPDGIKLFKEEKKELTEEGEKLMLEKLWGSAPKFEIIGIVPPKEPPKPPTGAPPEMPELPPQKKAEITRNYAIKVRQDIETLGGLENKNIVQDLNEIGGYRFENIQEVKDVLAILDKVLKPIIRPIKGVKMTVGEREINKMIMMVEKEQKTFLSKAQRDAIVNLHKIAEPSEITKFYKKEEIQSWIKAIKRLQSKKELSNMTVARIKKALQIENLKQTGQSKLEELYNFLAKLERGDAFLSTKQVSDLSDLLKSVENLELTTKRVLIDQFGEKIEIMPTGIVGKVMNELMPTVDIKEGHPLVTRVTNNADKGLFEAQKEIERRDENFEKMLTVAEKSRREKLPIKEEMKRFITPQNKEIFIAMSGGKIQLTREEVVVVAYLRNFFKKVRDELKLEKYRQNYITHLEKPLTEKILTDGILNAVIDIFKLRKKDNIPLNIMLELDNIIGSEKFFRFALERKGGISPTTNIRKILHDYSSLYETKKALDKILPEGQAIVKLLLQPQTAMWTKRFLQNLKGRGLDSNFRTGKMGWLANVADGIIDIGYIKLLGLNHWSALKNLTAGEANSFIYQDLRKYLLGKVRLSKYPIKSIKMALEYGVLEGTFADYSQKGIGKLKTFQDLLMIGQRVGEFEIRTSLFVSGLTSEEFATGKISIEKVRKIKDEIAITQGIFSKTDSPLWLQTWYGRLIMQMNRWRITNVMLLRRLVKDRNYKGLSKAFILYGIGMYLSYELGKAGYKKAAQVAQSMAEEINSIITFFPSIVNAITDNPTYQVLKEFSFTIQELANYIGVPSAQEPRKVEFQKGIEETWISPIERPKELMGIKEEKAKVPSMKIQEMGIPNLKIPSLR